jgi:hypothetical protein
MLNWAQLTIIAGAAVVAGVLCLFPPQLEVSGVPVNPRFGGTNVVVVERSVGRPEKQSGEYRRDTTRLIAECAFVAAIAAGLVAIAGARLPRVWRLRERQDTLTFPPPPIEQT